MEIHIRGYRGQRSARRLHEHTRKAREFRVRNREMEKIGELCLGNQVTPEIPILTRQHFHTSAPLLSGVTGSGRLSIFPELLIPSPGPQVIFPAT